MSKSRSKSKKSQLSVRRRKVKSGSRKSSKKLKRMNSSSKSPVAIKRQQ